MRFLLLEKYPNVSSEWVQQWTADHDKDVIDTEHPETNVYSRATLLDMFLKDTDWNLEGEDKKEVTSALHRSCFIWGLDPKKNKFIPFFDKFISKNPLMADSDKYFSKLLELVGRYRMSMEEDFLFNRSLYDRSIEDFDYTVKLLNTVNSPSELRKYFQDTSRIDPKLLYNGNSIKPVGDPNKDADNIDTLYGVVEHWAENGENDAVPEVKRDRRFTQQNPKSVDWSSIEKEHSYTSIDMIAASEETEGNIVHVGSLYIDATNNYRPVGSEAFVQFRKGQWVPLKVSN